jgi:hypothetical protein
VRWAGVTQIVLFALRWRRRHCYFFRGYPARLLRLVPCTGGYAPKPVVVAEGTAVGHKRILYFASGPIVGTSLTVTATQLHPAASVPHWRNVAVYSPCPLE